jgi:hypothetical protein
VFYSTENAVFDDRIHPPLLLPSFAEDMSAALSTGMQDQVDGMQYYVESLDPGIAFATTPGQEGLGDNNSSSASLDSITTSSPFEPSDQLAASFVMV